EALTMKRSAPPATDAAADRPDFLARLHEAYNLRRKNIVLLTGDVHGLFWNAAAKEFVGLEAALARELAPKFNLLRFDVATGVSFGDPAAEAAVTRVMEAEDPTGVASEPPKPLRDLIESSRYSPLAALVLLKGIAERVARARRTGGAVKPLCVLIQYAGAVFPAGEFDRLSELDRQRLVFFLSWVADPAFADGPELLILISPVRAEVNGKLTALSNVGHVEIGLPTERDRALFVRVFTAGHPELRFEHGPERFCRDAAGLAISHVKDLVEIATRTHDPVRHDDVVRE